MEGIKVERNIFIQGTDREELARKKEKRN